MKYRNYLDKKCPVCKKEFVLESPNGDGMYPFDDYEYITAKEADKLEWFCSDECYEKWEKENE